MFISSVVTQYGGQHFQVNADSQHFELGQCFISKEKGWKKEPTQNEVLLYQISQ